MQRSCRESPRSFVVTIAFCIGLTIGQFGTRLVPPLRPESAQDIAPRVITKATSHDYSDIRNQTRTAEELWKKGEGYIWLQHARKAGGTSLCMSLRANVKGLVKVVEDDFDSTLERTTCQILKFCIDCDLKKKFTKVPSLEPLVRNAMIQNHRNIFEVEGNGVPDDILSERWSDFVFISSIRHPMERIESALRNEHRFKSCHVNDGKTDTASCLSNRMGNAAQILESCQETIYWCFSNYLVRMFSGRERSYTNDADMLQRAKRNWHRFSCVVLQEEWVQSQSCLGERLGLYRRTESVYNVNGALKQATSESTRLSMQHEKLLNEEDYEMLVSLNQADLEFYEWAKQQIQSSYK